MHAAPLPHSESFEHAAVQNQRVPVGSYGFVQTRNGSSENGQLTSSSQYAPIFFSLPAYPFGTQLPAGPESVPASAPPDDAPPELLAVPLLDPPPLDEAVEEPPLDDPPPDEVDAPLVGVVGDLSSVVPPEPSLPHAAISTAPNITARFIGPPPFRCRR